METHEEVQIVLARSEHSEQVLRLLKESFIPREPLAIAVGMTWSDFDLGQEAIEKILEERCSFVALNSSGRVVGCRLSEIRKIDRNANPEPDYIEFAKDTEAVRRIQSAFRAVMSGWTKELPDSHVIMEFFIMCVEEQYARRSIAKTLVEKSLEKAEELRVDYVYTVATTWKSQRVFDKLGFRTMKEKKCDEIVDENGKPRFTMPDGTTHLKWMVKKINK